MSSPTLDIRTTLRARFGLVLALGAAMASQATAQHASVVNTVHNLSISGPGEVKSLTETEVCKFCHIPHNAVVPQPLWGHTLPRGTMYAVPEMRAPGGFAAAPQPDGSLPPVSVVPRRDSRPRRRRRGSPRPIPMAGSQRLGPGHRGYIGTDLSGSHPVSFVVPSMDPGLDSDRDMGLKPLGAIQADTEVRLDSEGKMQCTTCHDPHKDQFFIPDRVPRFWVKPTVVEVCLTCHELR